MRLFLGIDLPQDIKEYIYKIQCSLKNNQLVRIRWEGKNKLHLTLKFLGDVPDGEIFLLKEEIKKIKFIEFEVALTELGTFTSGFDITVLWTGVNPEKRISELQKQIDQYTLKYNHLKLGNPHITLGRIKSVKNKKRFLDKIKNTKIENIPFIINQFSLYKSVLTKDGARYEILENYSLTK